MIDIILGFQLQDVMFNRYQLQDSMFQLQKVARENSLKISVRKTNTMAFKGKYPVRTMIVINYSTLVQVNRFKYLGCAVRYESKYGSL